MRNKKLKKWLLYALVLLIAYILQTTIFNRFRILGIMSMPVPTVVACVAMFEGGDRGAAFGLGSGLLLALTNCDSSIFYLIGLTVAGAAVGGLCRNYLSSNLLTALLMSLMSLAICEGLVWLFGIAVGTLPLFAFVSVVLPVMFVSCLFTLVFYLPVRAIYKNIDDR